jgi:hypothetical protein
MDVASRVLSGVAGCRVENAAILRRNDRHVLAA